MEDKAELEPSGELGGDVGGEIVGHGICEERGVGVGELVGVVCLDAEIVYDTLRCHIHPTREALIYRVTLILIWIIQPVNAEEDSYELGADDDQRESQRTFDSRFPVDRGKWGLDSCWFVLHD